MKRFDIILTINVIMLTMLFVGLNKGVYSEIKGRIKEEIDGLYN